jgi:hypothetical protein
MRKIIYLRILNHFDYQTIIKINKNLIFNNNINNNKGKTV